MVTVSLSFKIISQNVRGLKDLKKRREVFYHFHKKPDVDIICLQETHLDDSDCSMWRNEWGGEAIWSNGKTDARGVGILVDRGKQIEVLKQKKDPAGRYVIIEFKMENTLFALLNIYAPNNDSLQFFLEVLSLLLTFEGKKIIMGDFNLVLDENLDRTAKTGKLANSDRAKEIIMQFMADALFTDIWRERNPTKKHFTFR